jgi:L-lactate oxidase
MAASRRNLIQALVVGGAALAAARGVTSALAQGAPVSAPPDFGVPSAQEHELKVVSVERLEDEARKILSPGRFAIMGPSGDGWTYRENRRAFNDFPIMPRRLQNVDDKDIELSTTLLGHTLPLPVFTCPTGAQGNFHVKAELPNAAGTGMAGAVGPHRRRFARRQKRLCAARLRAEVHHAVVGRRQGHEPQSR